MAAIMEPMLERIQAEERRLLEDRPREEPPIRDLAERAAKLIADLAARRDAMEDHTDKKREAKEAERRKKAAEIERLRHGTAN